MKRYTAAERKAIVKNFEDSLKAFVEMALAVGLSEHEVDDRVNDELMKVFKGDYHV